jgi:hypothetical protein
VVFHASFTPLEKKLLAGGKGFTAGQAAGAAGKNIEFFTTS